MMQVRELISGLPQIELSGPATCDVRALTLDSREVAPHSLFAALPGGTTDGLQFVPQAIAAGAIAVLSGGPRSPLTADSIAWLQSPRPREALAQIAKRLSGAPDERLHVIGVTGTKGKTTTVRLLEAVLAAGGIPTAAGGTLGQRFGSLEWPCTFTTPEAPRLWSFLARALEAGAEAAALEVSSVALTAARVHGMQFGAAVLTGIGHDHLDLHQSHEAYRRAKRMLFESLGDRALAVLPADDPHVGEFVVATGARRITFGTRPGADWQVERHLAQAAGATFELNSPKGRIEIRWNRPGLWDALNLTAALIIAADRGVPLETGAAAAAGLGAIPGRFERIDVGQPVLAVVDYAHTEESLRQVLQALRHITPGQLICAFGCGGDRDREKRPQMGRAAAEWADVVVITDDNPRHEDPRAIAAEIARGAAGGSARVEIVVPREAAIQQAVELAAAGDTILIAGKGHETYQDEGGRKRPFDDRAVLRSALQRRWGQA